MRLKKVGPKHDVIVLHLVDPSEGESVGRVFRRGRVGIQSAVSCFQPRFVESPHRFGEKPRRRRCELRFVTDQDLVGPLRHFFDDTCIAHEGTAMTITYRTMLITSMVAAITMNTAEFACAVERATQLVQKTRVESTANQSPSNEAPLRATVRRGLSGSIRFTHVNSGLEVRANQSVDGPVLVRLELMGSKGDVDDANTVYEYVLRFGIRLALLISRTADHRRKIPGAFR